MVPIFAQILAGVPALEALAPLGIGSAVWAFVAAATGALAGFAFARRRNDGDSARLSADTGVVDTPQLLWGVIELLETPALLLDGQGQVGASNRGVRELFPNVAPGMSLVQVTRNPELLSAVATASQGDAGRTLHVADRFGHGRRLMIAVTRVPDQLVPAAAGGEPSGPVLLLQFRDLTEQDRLAQMRSDFIANASHELRTPLASLKGFIETLKGPARDDPKARERFLVIMEAQAARMARILDDLLSLSRIEMRAHLMPEGIVDLAEIVRSVVHGLGPIMGKTTVAVKLESPDVGYRVRGDRDELEQVFQNLIHNGIKYGRDEGHVEVALRHLPDSGGRSGQIVVAVRDDGPGIAEEHIPRLTERFYRVDTAVSRERGGTGLGLAIVKHILNRHRGEINITSKLGEGSTFAVVLPGLD